MCHRHVIFSTITFYPKHLSFYSTSTPQHSQTMRCKRMAPKVVPSAHSSSSKGSTTGLVRQQQRQRTLLSEWFKLSVVGKLMITELVVSSPVLKSRKNNTRVTGSRHQASNEPTNGITKDQTYNTQIYAMRKPTAAFGLNRKNSLQKYALHVHMWVHISSVSIGRKVQQWDLCRRLSA